jgi:transglutaminase-like putative cysteine protease
MLLSIRHQTELAYDSRISESVMELRMAPRSDRHQTLRGFGMAVGPTAHLFEHGDWLGNRVHQFSVVGFHDRIVILAHGAIETHPQHPDAASLPDRLPLAPGDHRLQDFLRLEGPVGPDDRLEALAARLGLPGCERAGDVLERVAAGLREHIRYQKGVTSSATPVSGVLDAGAGVCQDFAHLAIALLRVAGIPARYVSGYLWRESAPSEVETHAWCEAFLPSVGWVGLDPTHRRTPGAGHVAVAVGRSYADVPPNRGVYRGDAKEAIRVAVTIEPVTEVPRGLLAPRAVEIDVTAHAAGPAVHRESIDYQQEQQQQQQ